MIIVADESVDFSVIEALRLEGYNVDAIVTANSGISDEQVIEIVNLKKALILTKDKDFGELTFRLRIKNNGIILLRLFGLPNNEKAILTVRIFNKFDTDFRNSFLL